MKILMEDWGADVLAVASCDEALAWLSRRDVVPDLVIADYKLRNRMTGVEAIERIRTDIKPSIPCLILTGDANLQRLKQSGFTVLCKPVYPGMLGNLLRHVFRENLAKLPPPMDAVQRGGAV